MNTKHWAFAAAVLFSTTAHAATICVNPKAPACQATIGGAVAIAGPGDRVAIAAGTYYEAVVVPPGKEGLQITGTGKTTIIDPSPNQAIGFLGGTAALAIASRDVQIRTLTIRNGIDGIDATARGLVVQGCSLVGQDNVAINVSGYGAQILGNEIRSGGTGVFNQGFGTIVKGNTVTDMVQVGILDAGGDAVQVIGNTIANSVVGMQIQGDGAVIQSNMVKYAQPFGIASFGANPTIRLNAVDGILGMGVFTNCINCWGGSIALNTISDTLNQGILATADSPGLRIQGNTIARSGAEGLLIAGAGIVATQNRISDAGNTLNVPCISVQTDSAIVTRNTAANCAAAGIRAHGNLNDIESNTVMGTYENGITVDGDNGGNPALSGTQLVANKLTGNAGQGIAVINGADSTFLKANIASKNRLDFCDDGANTIFGAGNVFGTQASTGGTDCVIAH